MWFYFMFIFFSAEKWWIPMVNRIRQHAFERGLTFEKRFSTWSLQIFRCDFRFFQQKEPFMAQNFFFSSVPVIYFIENTYVKINDNNLLTFESIHFPALFFPFLCVCVYVNSIHVSSELKVNNIIGLYVSENRRKKEKMRDNVKSYIEE